MTIPPSPDAPDVEIDPAAIRTTSATLSGDPRRQAIPSIRGYVYQALWSVDAWLRLTTADEVIYLEGAEDLDRVERDGATVFQVRNTQDSLSLNTAKARDALEHFWTLQLREQGLGRRVSYHYITTSQAAEEKDAAFGCGIELWQAAQTNVEIARTLVDYLLPKLNHASRLHLFLESASVETIQASLFCQFHWLLDQPDIEGIKSSIDARLADILDAKGRSLSHIDGIRARLESHVWEVIVRPETAQRKLTRLDLLQIVESSTSTHLALSPEQLATYLSHQRNDEPLLALVRENIPRAPEPLLRRPHLTEHIRNLLIHRKAVLLTGTVHKGKTTLAQLTSADVCPDAWWITLTGRPTNDIVTLLLALARALDQGGCPALIVIDDLNMSPGAINAYRNAISTVLVRARSAGRGLLITSQGDGEHATVVDSLRDVAIVEVPEMTADEITPLCEEMSCPKDDAPAWGHIIEMLTLGHPKLVQIRLSECVERGWGPLSTTDLTTPSEGIRSARLLARGLVRDTLSVPVAEYLYTISECSLLIDRTIAVRIAESTEGLTNAGDVIDQLSGTWLEHVAGIGYRATPLLKGVATEVWSDSVRKHAHMRIFDAVYAKRPNTPAEAAALLFHGYASGDNSRLGTIAIKLQLIEDAQAAHQVHQHLVWLVYVCIEPNQTICAIPAIDSIVRALQFRVAASLDVAHLGDIAARWMEALLRIDDPDLQNTSRSIFFGSVGFLQSRRLPLQYKLWAIQWFANHPLEHSNFEANDFEQKPYDGIPETATAIQMLLLNLCQGVRGLENLDAFVTWLESPASEGLRQDIENILTWPIMQALGAFVQTAWATVSEDVRDWAEWLPVLKRIDTYARSYSSPNLGVEAAKARAIILTEYLDRSVEALGVLDEASSTYGQSPLLTETRANNYFQRENYGQVLAIWDQLEATGEHQALDPFAYRRAAISAARLGHWRRASEIFLAGGTRIAPGELPSTRFALDVDAALALAYGGELIPAASILAAAVCRLPREASQEEDGRWEAVLRGAAGVCQEVSNALWQHQPISWRFTPGFASSPDFVASPTTPGQALRTEWTRAQVLHLLCTAAADATDYVEDIDRTINSPYPPVRWTGAEAHLVQILQSGTGKGLMAAVLTYERAIVTLGLYRQERAWDAIIEAPDYAEQPFNLDACLGMIHAGLICTDKTLAITTQTWREEAYAVFGSANHLDSVFDEIDRVISCPPELLIGFMRDTNEGISARVAAAVRLLGIASTADEIFNLQAYLTSALMSGSSRIRQLIYNRVIAKRWARDWRAQIPNRVQFYTPRTSIPALEAVLDTVEHGNGTLRDLLNTVSAALHFQLGRLTEHLD